MHFVSSTMPIIDLWLLIVTTLCTPHSVNKLAVDCLIQEESNGHFVSSTMPIIDYYWFLLVSWLCTPPCQLWIFNGFFESQDYVHHHASYWFLLVFSSLMIMYNITQLWIFNGFFESQDYVHHHANYWFLLVSSSLMITYTTMPIMIFLWLW